MLPSVTEYQFNAGSGRLAVRLAVQETGGAGLNCFFSGGERPHVGGVAAAVPRMKTGGEGTTSDQWVVSLPGHKDALLAQKLAVRLAEACGEPVVVTVGIHIDAATVGELSLLEENCEELVRTYLAHRKARPGE